MQKVKWIFFGYVALVALIIIGIGVSLGLTPPRDPSTLYTAYGANIKSLDPAEVNDTQGDAIANQIYECLYNYKYGVQPYELFPELAAEMPHYSADNKTVTVKIRPGIHFYDPDKVVFPDGIGPEVKAQDFVYSWKRVANFYTASPLYSQIFEGHIVGLDDWWTYTKSVDRDKVDWNRPVEGLQALDDRTLQIKLVDPFPQLNFNLAYLPSAAVCRQAVEKYGLQFRKHPVGTGPYCMKYGDHLPEQRIIMNANPTYRGRPDVDGGATVPENERLPKIKRMEYDYFEEALPVWLLFQQGLFDVAGIPKDSFHQAINGVTGELSDDLRKRGVVLEKSPEPAAYYFGFNMQDPIVGKNKPLRQAMSMAFDRETFIKTFLNGRGLPAIGPIPPGFPTFDAKYVNPYTRYDLGAARRKMAEAERINGGPIPPLQLLMGSTDTDARQQADFFTTQMKLIGVTVQVEYRTWARFQEMVDNRQTQIFDLGWVADYPDEQDFLQLFYGKNASPGGSNPTAYVNPAFDALYEKAAVMNRSPQRDELYRKMQQMVMEDCPWGIEFYPLAYSLHYDWVQNLQPMDYGHGLRANIVLDSKLRLQRQGHGS